MNQFPYLYPHSLSEAERLNEEELWQDNRDAEVSHTQLTEMFRHSDPAALMDEAEQAQLAELDDTVTVRLPSCVTALRPPDAWGKRIPASSIGVRLK